VDKSFETVAYTGSAAFNAKGATIHSAFHPMPFIPGATPDDRGSTLARSLPELLYQLLSTDVSRNTGGGNRHTVAADGEGAARRINWEVRDPRVSGPRPPPA